METTTTKTMSKSEFKNRVSNIIAAVKEHAANDLTLSGEREWMGHTFASPFHYAAQSEFCMERRLAEVDKERQTSFMSDLSIGEWYGLSGLLDTVRKVVNEWKDNEVFIAEFILCLNWKSWEHHARKNAGWMELYAVLFEEVRDLLYDYYESDVQKSNYLWEYLD